MSMNIAAPKSGATLPKNIAFLLNVTQRIEGGPFIQGSACAQWALEEDGPWVTARMGEGGNLECPHVPWEERYESFPLAPTINAACWVRVGVWPDQGLEGEPTHVSDNAVQLLAVGYYHAGPLLIPLGMGDEESDGPAGHEEAPEGSSRG
jgi:hypothetical protein